MCGLPLVRDSLLEKTVSPSLTAVVTSSLARGDTYCPPPSPYCDLVCLCLPESCACCPVSITFLTVSHHQELAIIAFILNLELSPISLS